VPGTPSVRFLREVFGDNLLDQLRDRRSQINRSVFQFPLRIVGYMNSLSSATLKISGKEPPINNVLEINREKKLNASRGLKTEPRL
jgi:hypothetical protein